MSFHRNEWGLRSGILLLVAALFLALVPLQSLPRMKLQKVRPS